MALIAGEACPVGQRHGLPLSPARGVQPMCGWSGCLRRSSINTKAAAFTKSNQVPNLQAPAIDKLSLALQLPFLQVSESMGNHDSKIVDAASVD